MTRNKYLNEALFFHSFFINFFFPFQLNIFHEEQMFNVYIDGKKFLIQILLKDHGLRRFKSNFFCLF